MKKRRIRLYGIVFVSCLFLLLLLFFLTREKESDPFSVYKKALQSSVTECSTTLFYQSDEVLEQRRTIDTYQEKENWNICFGDEEGKQTCIAYKNGRLTENGESRKVDPETAQEIFERYNFCEFPQVDAMKNVFLSQESEVLSFSCQIDPAFIPKAFDQNIDQKEIENCNYTVVIDQKNHRMISQRIDLLLRSEESYSIFSNFS